jgi:hypothetical protein
MTEAPGAMFWQRVLGQSHSLKRPSSESMIGVRSLSANETPYLHTLHTLQTGVHNASLYKLNHFRSFGFSPAAPPPIFLLRPSFRSSIVAIKYRSASIA